MKEGRKQANKQASNVFLKRNFDDFIRLGNQWHAILGGK